MTVYADLGDFGEDDRIRTIGASIGEGNITGFIVEDDAKADRYLRKLATYKVRLIDRQPFTDKTHDDGCPRQLGILVKVGPPES